MRKGKPIGTNGLRERGRMRERRKEGGLEGSVVRGRGWSADF